MKKITVAAAVVISLAGLSACSGGPCSYSMGSAVASLTGLGTYKDGKEFDAEALNSFEKGKTTEAAIIEALGEPEGRSSDSEGNTRLKWTYYESK